MEARLGMQLEAHQGVAQQVCCMVDPIREVGGVVDLVVVVAKSVVSQSLLKNLMLTWRSTMPNQCRSTKILSKLIFQRQI
uniref:Uncharacterized protein n=1 Tax=Arundo donax TaxID=35708 RepID=A0A0A9E191_ARUDO